MKEKIKYSVSFKNTQKEQELKKWFEKKIEIVGSSAYIKTLLMEKKAMEEATK